MGISSWVQDTLRRVQGQILWRKTQLQDFRLVGFEHHGSLESLKYLRLGWWFGSIRCVEPSNFWQKNMLAPTRVWRKTTFGEHSKRWLSSQWNLHTKLPQGDILDMYQIADEDTYKTTWWLDLYSSRLQKTTSWNWNKYLTYRSLLLNNPWWHCSLLLVQCWESVRELPEPMSP